MAHPICSVLDLDDTLYLERDYVRSGFRAVDRLARERVGIQGFGDACWRRFLNGDRGDIFDTVLLSRYGLADADLVGELVRVYRSHKPSIELLPDSVRFLGKAQSLALPLALITDGPQASQRAKIDALELGRYCSPIVVTAELGDGKSKPHPAAFERVQAALGPGKRFCYIADNPAKDFVAPNRLGWMSIRIQRAGGLYREMTAPTREYAAQYSVAALDDVWPIAAQTAKPRR